MKKHAYLILAHACPGQLGKLLELLDDPRNDLYVHIDGKADFGPEDFTGCCRHSRLHFIEPRISVHWAGFSQIQAIVALLEAAVQQEGGYAYYHLISGQDMPIKNQDTIHAFFDEHAGKEFLDLWKESPHTHNRYHYRALFPEGAHLPATNLLNHIYKGLQKMLGLKINRDYKFYFASTWFSITHPCAQYIVSQKDWIRDTFRQTCGTDEFFVPTLVMNADFRDHLYEGPIIGNLRFIDWTRGESSRHPWVFRSADWELLAASPCFWARKFDERVDAEIILRLYRELKG